MTVLATDDFEKSLKKFIPITKNFIENNGRYLKKIGLILVCKLKS